MRIGKLKRLYESPDITNAAINRRYAMRLFRHGWTPDEIAAAFPRAFFAHTENGRRVLGQQYDGIYPDGRKETRYLIHAEVLEQLLQGEAHETA